MLEATVMISGVLAYPQAADEPSEVDSPVPWLCLQGLLLSPSVSLPGLDPLHESTTWLSVPAGC